MCKIIFFFFNKGTRCLEKHEKFNHLIIFWFLIQFDYKYPLRQNDKINTPASFNKDYSKHSRLIEKI